MSINSDKLKLLVDFKKRIETKINQIESELIDLKLTLDTLNYIIIQKGFKRGDIKKAESKIGKTKHSKNSSLIKLNSKIYNSKEDETVIPLKTKNGESLAIMLTKNKILHILPDESKVDYLQIHTYHYDPTLAPDGKTIISIQIPTTNFEFWHHLREGNRDEYNIIKKKVADKIIEIVETKMGSIQEYLELVDVTTPATYQRYTNNWNGSVQGWMPPDDFLASKPFKKELPGLKQFYMIGQWVYPGGGLPTALIEGRNVAQIISKRDKRKFTVK